MSDSERASVSLLRASLRQDVYRSGRRRSLAPRGTQPRRRPRGGPPVGRDEGSAHQRGAVRHPALKEGNRRFREGRTNPADFPADQSPAPCIAPGYCSAASIRAPRRRSLQPGMVHLTIRIAGKARILTSSQMSSLQLAVGRWCSSWLTRACCAGPGPRRAQLGNPTVACDIRLPSSDRNTGKRTATTGIRRCRWRARIRADHGQLNKSKVMPS